VKVSIYSDSVSVNESVTTSNGQASFDNVPPATDYIINAQTNDYRSAQLISQTVPEDYSIAAPSKNFELPLGAAVPPVTVTVSVRHVTQSSTPCLSSTDYLSSASVKLEDPDIPYVATSTTNSSGTSVFNGVPQGIYDFTASKSVRIGYKYYTKTGNVLDKTINGNITVCVPIVY
jgi:hypothetical protein